MELWSVSASLDLLHTRRLLFSASRYLPRWRCAVTETCVDRRALLTLVTRVDIQIWGRGNVRPSWSRHFSDSLPSLANEARTGSTLHS